MFDPAPASNSPLICADCSLGARGDCPASSDFDGMHVQRVSVRRIATGAEIYAVNETPDTVAVLQSGWAIRYARLNGGERQILSFYIPGDVFDQDAVILTQTPTLFAIRALTDAVVCYLPIEEYRGLMNGDIHSRRFARRHLRRHQTLAAKHVIDIGRRRAPGRIAGLLLELRQRLQERGLADGEIIPFPLRQEDIADALGLTHAHVNRTLMALRQQRAIEVLPGALHILDLDALRALAPNDLS